MTLYRIAWAYNNNGCIGGNGEYYLTLENAITVVRFYNSKYCGEITHWFEAEPESDLKKLR